LPSRSPGAPRARNPFNFAPRRVLDSPFLTADYDSGVVTISKGRRKKVLAFNQIAASK
jgi:hypothetical protein